MPANAAAPPASCSTAPAGEAARCSPNRSVPRRTPEAGSTVSMIGRLAASVPAWKALADNNNPARPSASKTQGCQCARAAPRPSARTSRVKLSVTAAVSPNTTPAAVASRAARTASVPSLPTVSARTQTNPTTPKTSAQYPSGASDRPDEGGEAARKTATPPSSGRSDAPLGYWALVFGVVGFVCVLALTVGRLGTGAVRTALLATAAGVVFGLTAAVTLSFTRLVRAEGLGAALAHWQPWALLALGLAGLLLSASAFQAGALAASLPIMDTVEPASGVLLGTLLFGEHLAASPAGAVLQLAGGAAAFAGIALLGKSPPRQLLEAR